MSSSASKHIGKKYNSLTVLKINGYYIGNDKWRRPKVLCLCDCGKRKTILLKDILSGKTQSCTCLQRENKYTTHKMTGTTEYRIYNNMISKCYRKNGKSYKYYGARGIRVCKRWLDKFENFYLDMGDRPSLKHSLDRINNNGNYEPNNCRWATAIQQAANKRTGIRYKIYSYDNKTMNLTDWAKYFNINYQTLHTRINIQKLSFREAIKINL